MPTMHVDDVLMGVTAATVPAEVERWVAPALGQLAAEADTTHELVALEGAEVADASSDRLTRLANAALLADWACYASKADRVDLGRLRTVMTCFPAGFRVWFSRGATGSCLPVGYTGWYPIAPEAFDRVHDHPETIASRGELRPLPTLGAAPCLWLFNYSIVAPLRRSAHSRRMLGLYAEDLGRVPYRGLAAAVLSPESRRVVGRLGMTFRGQLRHDGAPEDVYALRR